MRRARSIHDVRAPSMTCTRAMDTVKAVRTVSLATQSRLGGNVSVQAADGGECPQTALCVVICTDKVGAHNARSQ